jgi:hypothetical protein
VSCTSVLASFVLAAKLKASLVPQLLLLLPLPLLLVVVWSVAAAAASDLCAAVMSAVDSSTAFTAAHFGLSNMYRDLAALGVVAPLLNALCVCHSGRYVHT